VSEMQPSRINIRLPSLDVEEPLGPIAKQWRWVLKWWAGLITFLTLFVPTFVLLVGFNVIELPKDMFIAYVSAATGGNTLLAIAGTYLLRPFAKLEK